MPTEIKDDNHIPEILKELSELSSKSVDVGWFGEMAIIAGVQEYGARIQVTDAMRGMFAAMGFPLKESTKYIEIPERAPLRTTAEKLSALDHLADVLEAELFELLNGRKSASQVLAMMGEVMVGEVRDTVANGLKPENHPMTILMKGSAKPLIASGDLLRELGWEEVND
ncbi:MAG: hypothetical protein OEZ34_16780 [Spirochaetia bacterium]|nr:hypothetical protein [Spirochaetia bacterium]